jgi:N-acetylglucosaminyl-diphospho-decaprenol L-rhamnosyltransferase
VWHRGMATFGRVYGGPGCDDLALRNTLLFQWKNLRHPFHLARQMAGLPLRLTLEMLRAPWTPPARRWRFTRALVGAVARRRQQSAGAPGAGDLRREREFFYQFHPREMSHV